ncbi:hypothetical protein [Pedobacter frigiditerrae]|uniref:hypothetical protein n=1 Tax=Pedobacter frigiditerrae TaxID=2530452 RepID=UPI0013F173DD|nr:hypothetical protein [Pedobacter frigiditerrae]
MSYIEQFIPNVFVMYLSQFLVWIKFPFASYLSFIVYHTNGILTPQIFNPGNGK